MVLEIKLVNYFNKKTDLKFINNTLKTLIIKYNFGDGFLRTRVDK